MKGVIGGVLGLAILCTGWMLFIAALVTGDQSAKADTTTLVIPQNVPSEYKQAVGLAGSICSGVSPVDVAAFIEVTNGYKPDAPRLAGRESALLLPTGTFAALGRDGNDDQKVSADDFSDAIVTAGKFFCVLSPQLRALIDAGEVSGDVFLLSVAVWKTDLETVKTAKGVPENVRALVESMGDKRGELNASGVGAPLLSGGGITDSGACLFPDPTRPGVAGACVTARTKYFISAAKGAEVTGRGGKNMYCWDAHRWNPLSDHPKGKACDLIYSSGFAKGAELSEGNRALNWIMANWEPLGVSYVIWQGQIWEAPYQPKRYASSIYNVLSANGGHYNHIHISFK